MSRTKTIIFLAFFGFALSQSQYDQNDAISFLYASALAYCSLPSVQSWNCGPPCQNLAGYQFYYGVNKQVLPNEYLSFTMIVNPSAQKFITSFRGTVGSVQLLLEILEGTAEPYTLHNISNALVMTYFNKHYTTNLRTDFITSFNKARAEYPNYQYKFHCVIFHRLLNH